MSSLDSTQRPIAPAGDPAFVPLYDSRLRWSVRRAWLQVTVREGFQKLVGIPLERVLLRRWLARRPGAETLERLGLPRRALQQRLKGALTLHVDPRRLIRITDWNGYPRRLRPVSTAFIWQGEWDLRRGDLRFGPRYRFISNLVEYRDDLTKSERFAELAALLRAGQPWKSHQQGILLDTEERILIYLHAYLGFYDDMAARGFDARLGKDALGVAVSREGRLIKINRGLHRLAMAQHLGLSSVPVEVCAVHREWWERVVGAARGHAALEKMRVALRDCVPETRPGTKDPIKRPSGDAWPAPRAENSSSSTE